MKQLFPNREDTSGRNKVVTMLRKTVLWADPVTMVVDLVASSFLVVLSTGVENRFPQ